MKTIKRLNYAFLAVVLISIGLIGCEDPFNYKIEAPSDLQAKIDSIAAAKAAIDTGDTTFIDISTTIVGAEDNSDGWWTSFTDYFTIPSNKLLHLEFVNYSSGVNNWNNWNLAVTNAQRDADGYSEYFVLRSDAFGWGNSDFDLGLITQDYPDTDGDLDIWNDFRATMDGAYVTIEVDHSITGNAFVTATAVGTNGTVLTETYQQPVSAVDDIVAFLICDGSHFEMKKAYLLPSKVTVVEDVEPVSISVSGTPASVEIGNENFWGAGVATVTFADGSSTQVDSVDLSFNVIPDMTTIGDKVVSVAYSKTKQGVYTQAVSTSYNLTVTNVVTSLAVTTMPTITTYYYFNSDPIIFNTSGLVVTATYIDNSTGVISNDNLVFGSIPAAAGAQNVDVSFVGASSTVSTTVPLTLIQGTSQVGATDLSTGFWGAHTADFTVTSGTSKVFKLYVYSTGVNGWNSPATILRKADLTEYAVVRMDNYGWGTGYGTATLTSDWNWDIFSSSISGSYVEITVTNNGDNTADVRYDVTYATGEVHFQQYTGITIDSADLTTALTVDNCYLVLVN